ncbi:MAG: hypothetical protein QOF29_3617, partial [bacterium]
MQRGCRTVGASDGGVPANGTVSGQRRELRRPRSPPPGVARLGGGFLSDESVWSRMFHLLARMARTLSLHWKRSLAAAVGVLVLLVLAAGGGGQAKDDYSVPGAESQQAIDLFQAHSPAFGGADSTLVFTVDKG